ncbi:MFS transporter [Nonomuraea phyllanthi]|uniref:MFS transporter n=1 Tax=Nonomuraea phyllanthi TaxID=2219224 RepID=A0A5C4W1R2_9ACTN|nr:MFS transporter [Nonomuraea phyllanthi]KAB8191456.1 MFS transporter [Nonomuraea phyllanthi]QFY13217.1 MFS transporter [Nonomuraea phyllanthi]
MHSYLSDLGLLRDRRFALLASARTIAVLGAAFAPVALAFGILDLPGATASTLSAVLTAESVPMIAFILFGGVLADRFSRKWVLMTGDVLMAAGYWGLAVMLLTGWTPLPALCVAAALSGVATAIAFPALTGIIPEVVPLEQLQAGNALIGLGSNAARVAGAVLGGGAVVLFGGGWALAVGGAMFAVAGLLIALLPRARHASVPDPATVPEPTALPGSAAVPGSPAFSETAAVHEPAALPDVTAVPGPAALPDAAVPGAAAVPEADAAGSPQEGGRQSVLVDLRDGWREFSSRQWIWVVVAQFSLIVMAIQAGHGVLGPLLAKESMGGPGAWSAFLAGEAVGTIVGVLTAMRLRARRPILVAVLLCLPVALPYVLLGVDAPLWAIVIGAFVLGVCFDVFGVLWQTTMQREIPGESLSRVSSYDMLGSLMFGPIGLLLAGRTAEWFGTEESLIGCAVIILVSTLAALLAPGVRNLRAPGDAPEKAPQGVPASG